MNENATARAGMASPAINNSHGQRSESKGQGIPSTYTSGSSNRNSIGCELAAEVIRTSGSLRVKAAGASMLPAVWPGDILSVSSHDPSEVEPGDVVLFEREGRLVAHRVVMKRESGLGTRDSGSGKRDLEYSSFKFPVSPQIEFVTRGDSIGSFDHPPVAPHEFLGRVTAIERGDRQIVPRQTYLTRIMSWFLSRSSFATRVVLWART